MNYIVVAAVVAATAAAVALICGKRTAMHCNRIANELTYRIPNAESARNVIHSVFSHIYREVLCNESFCYHCLTMCAPVLRLFINEYTFRLHMPKAGGFQCECLHSEHCIRWCNRNCSLTFGSPHHHHHQRHRLVKTKGPK